MFRSSCSECGSAQLSWMSAADLAETVPPEQRNRVAEGVVMTGADADAWLCEECGGFGLLGGGGVF